jgi:Sensors of blue-light using FAD
MRDMQLIYVSRPFGFDDTSLKSILYSARASNKRDGITGALICRADIYLQMLEGPRDKLTTLYSKILRDGRHTDVVTLYAGDVETRLFPNWDMRHDPARTWLWTRDEIWDGAVTNASADTIRAIFARVANEAVDADSVVLF